MWLVFDIEGGKEGILQLANIILILSIDRLCSNHILSVARKSLIPAHWISRESAFGSAQNAALHSIKSGHTLTLQHWAPVIIHCSDQPPRHHPYSRSCPHATTATMEISEDERKTFREYVAEYNSVHPRDAFLIGNSRGETGFILYLDNCIVLSMRSAEAFFGELHKFWSGLPAHMIENGHNYWTGTLRERTRRTGKYQAGFQNRIDFFFHYEGASVDFDAAITQYDCENSEDNSPPWRYGPAILLQQWEALSHTVANPTGSSANVTGSLGETFT